MHEVCAATGVTNSHFETFELLLEQDARLLCIKNNTGATPLELIPAEHYTAWTDFLESILDIYWIPLGRRRFGQIPSPALTDCQPNSRPIADPSNALPLVVARMLAN
jgi:hypothetical protein